jgi:hypothetical protein
MTPVGDFCFDRRAQFVCGVRHSFVLNYNNTSDMEEAYNFWAHIFRARHGIYLFKSLLSLFLRVAVYIIKFNEILVRKWPGMRLLPALSVL